MSSNGFCLKGFMEKFLLRMDKSQDLREKLAAIDTECELEYNGSCFLKDIMILVGFINCRRMSEIPSLFRDFLVIILMEMEAV